MDTGIIHYALGFAFDDVGRVALIKKQRPMWQYGLWNGVGGKVKPDEPVEKTIVREFEEETGVLLDAWRACGIVRTSNGYINVFTTKSEAVRNVRTMTDEYVQLHTVWDLPLHCIPNVRPMILLCQIERDPPFFELFYSSPH